MAGATERYEGVRGAAPEAGAVEIDVAAVLAVLRRQRRVIRLCAAVALGLGILYLVIASPVFTATAAVMVDTRRNQMMQLNNEQQMTDALTDAALVDSQVETLKSEQIARAVVAKLALDADPEFIGEPPGPVGLFVGDVLRQVRQWLDIEEETDPDAAVKLALEAFAKALDVKRVGTSYVIEVSFSSKDKAKSARIANAVADTYIADQVGFRSDVMRRAGNWLETRILELRKQASEAEAAVQTFRQKNNLIDANGKLFADQQLSELTSQLATARSETAAAQARLERIRAILSSDVADGSVADTLRNDVIVKLRQQYNDAAKREAEWSSRYGANHSAAANLRAEMQQIERSIREELRRIGRTYESDFEIARVREQSLQKQIDDILGEVNQTRQATVRLRELESSAQSYRTMHDTFLQRYVQAVQQQSSPITEARVISAAIPPRRKSSPKTLIVLGVTLAAGLLAGSGIGFLREALDRRVKTSADAEAVTGALCLGVLPLVPRREARAARRARRAEEAASSIPVELRAVFRDPLLTHVLGAPFSQFTETLRSVKVAVDAGGPAPDGRVIGVVSSVPGEGKTTLAANLALLIAQTGRRVTLIDGDLRNPALTHGLSRAPTLGLVEVLLGRATPEAAMLTEVATGLRFLPVISDRRLTHSNEIISSQAMRELLRTLRAESDYVIVDLPPLGPIVDTRAAAGLVDEFVMAVAWSSTPVATVQRALATTPAVREALVGVVLSKVDLERYGEFEGQGGYYYDPEAWERYGAPAA